MTDRPFLRPPPGQRTFLIEAQQGADVVLRVLGPFAVQGVEILTMEASQRIGGLSIRIEAGPFLVTAAITRDSVEELGLAEGKAATAIVKATSVMVVEGDR